jgi:hypothetical protein
MMQQTAKTRTPHDEMRQQLGDQNGQLDWRASFDAPSAEAAARLDTAFRDLGFESRRLDERSTRMWVRFPQYCVPRVIDIALAAGAKLVPERRRERTKDPTSFEAFYEGPREKLKDRLADIEKLRLALEKIEPHIEPAVTEEGTRVLIIGGEEVSIEGLSPAARKHVDDLERVRLLLARLLWLLG